MLQHGISRAKREQSLKTPSKTAEQSVGTLCESVFSRAVITHYDRPADLNKQTFVPARSGGQKSELEAGSLEPPREKASYASLLASGGCLLFV